jgi:carotenoid cleavage dioxygenase-like enzyme
MANTAPDRPMQQVFCLMQLWHQLSTAPTVLPGLVLTGPRCCTLPAPQTVRSFTCPTFFFFHVGNAYESADGSSLLVDLAGYDDPQILLDLGLDPLRQPRTDTIGALQQQVSSSTYRRLTIPLQGQGGDRLQVGRSGRAEGQGCTSIVQCIFVCILPLHP